MNNYKLTFRPAVAHNPTCNILEFHSLNKEYFITFGMYLETGEEFIEYYSGPNYCAEPKSTKSYSRCYNIGKDKLPKWIAEKKDDMRKHFEELLLENKKQVK